MLARYLVLNLDSVRVSVPLHCRIKEDNNKKQEIAHYIIVLVYHEHDHLQNLSLYSLSLREILEVGVADLVYTITGKEVQRSSKALTKR